MRPLQQAPASPDFLQYWVGNHSLNMAALNKPLLLEEFGVEVEPPASAAGGVWFFYHFTDCPMFSGLPSKLSSLH